DKGTKKVTTDDRLRARERAAGFVESDLYAKTEAGGETPARIASSASLPGTTNDPDLPAGEKVGEYVIEEQVGRGGFGTVYRAVQPLIGKRVAIKVLARKYSADDVVVSRFVAEARAVNQIR